MTDSYAWSNKMSTYSYTVLWFYIPSFLFAVCKQSLQIVITILASELNIWANYEYFQTGMSENGTIHTVTYILYRSLIHITMMKKWIRHILFLRKRGLIVYLAALKTGTICAAHPYYVIYRWLTPPPPPPPPRVYFLLGLLLCLI